ncbi:hypothetical protein D9758_012972 [Tetrapyrgos nigripes]|uniref:OPA3-like protein n=1 Tax=Tetrapyrgos nigripes TaxID=182062 RepID=A0A8H5CLN0_9AGAR|nr:hypothetical protein D9758_012972 [Tetrapyrgos nigripes]
MSKQLEYLHDNRHETFREFCVNLAQRMHRTEAHLRTRLLGEPAKHIRPLSETRCIIFSLFHDTEQLTIRVVDSAIENGANALAEGFLFAVAAALIIGEQWRSSRSQSKRRDDVNEKLEDLDEKVKELNTRLGSLTTSIQEQLEAERTRSTELARILERVVEIGLRGGWSELEQTPLRLPRIDLSSSLSSPSSESDSESLSNDTDSPPSPEDSRIDVNTPDPESKDHIDDRNKPS